MEADRLVIRIDVEGRDAQREVEGVSRALRGLSGSARQGARGLHEASRASRQTEANFKQLSHTARQVQHAIRMVYGALAAYATLRTAQEVINIAASFERMRVMLTTLTGSAAEAQRSMRWILDMGARAPQGVDAVADAFVKLRSVGIDPTARSLKALVDAVSAFGGSAFELERAVVAVQQMAGKGVVSMEELRQQLAEVIPTAGHIMARELSMSYRDFVDQVAQGNIEATSAIQALFRGLEKEYGGASEKMSRTWIGLMNRLRTEVKLFVNEVMKSGPFQGLKAGVSDLLDTISRLRKEGKLDEWARKTAEWLLKAAHYVFDLAQGLVELSRVAVPAGKTFLSIIDQVWGVYRDLPKEIQSVGLLGVLFFGKKGALALGAGLGLYNKFITGRERQEWFNLINAAVAEAQQNYGFKIPAGMPRKGRVPWLLKQLEDYLHGLGIDPQEFLRMVSEKRRVRIPVTFETYFKIHNLQQAIEGVKQFYEKTDHSTQFFDAISQKIKEAQKRLEELKSQIGPFEAEKVLPLKSYEEVTKEILKNYEQIEEKQTYLESDLYKQYEELITKGVKDPEEFERIRDNFVQGIENLKQELIGINPVTEEAAEKWYELQDSINETSEGVRRAIDSYIDYLQTQRKVNDTLETYEDVIKPINELLREQALENLPEVEREIARVNEKWAEFAYRIEEAYRYGKISEQEAIRLIETINQWRDREIAALNETVQIHKDKAEQIKQIWDDTYKGLGDTLAEWIVEFNFDLNSITDLFRFMSKRILSTWIETWIKMQVVQTQAAGGGLFGSLIKAIPFIGGLFSGGAAVTSGPVEILTVNDLNLVPAYHQGGVVGETPAPMRLVPSYIFNNAPRLHSGLLPNEFPAILERGEVVIPRLFWNEFLKQINTKVDKRTFNVNVNVYVPTRQDDTEQANLSASHIGYKVAEAIKNFVIIQE